MLPSHITQFYKSSQVVWPKVGEHLTNKAHNIECLYAVALRFLFAETKGPKHIPAIVLRLNEQIPVIMIQNLVERLLRKLGVITAKRAFIPNGMFTRQHMVVMVRGPHTSDHVMYA